MLEAFLHTKLYALPLRLNLHPPTHLIERVNQGLELGHKLILIYALAGLGKTTLVNECVTHN